MHIHQLSVTYEAEQDRILARISTSSGDEMRMWLTRRLVHGLWPLLTQAQARTEQAPDATLPPAAPVLAAARQWMADARKQALLAQSDFDTPFREAVSLPLGEAPLLVTEVDVTPLAAGRLRVGFTERLPGAATAGAASAAASAGRSFQLELEPALLHALLHLLDQAVAMSQWRLPLGTGLAKPDATPSLDDEGPPARPRYLN